MRQGDDYGLLFLDGLSERTMASRYPLFACHVHANTEFEFVQYYWHGSRLGFNRFHSVDLECINTHPTVTFFTCRYQGEFLSVR